MRCQCRCQSGPFAGCARAPFAAAAPVLATPPLAADRRVAAPRRAGTAAAAAATIPASSCSSSSTRAVCGLAAARRHSAATCCLAAASPATPQQRLLQQRVVAAVLVDLPNNAQQPRAQLHARQQRARGRSRLAAVALCRLLGLLPPAVAAERTARWLLAGLLLRACTACSERPKQRASAACTHHRRGSAACVQQRLLHAVAHLLAQRLRPPAQQQHRCHRQRQAGCQQMAPGTCRRCWRRCCCCSRPRAPALPAAHQAPRLAGSSTARGAVMEQQHMAHTHTQPRQRAATGTHPTAQLLNTTHLAAPRLAAARLRTAPARQRHAAPRPPARRRSVRRATPAAGAAAAAGSSRACPGSSSRGTLRPRAAPPAWPPRSLARQRSAAPFGRRAAGWAAASAASAQQKRGHAGSRAAGVRAQQQHVAGRLLTWRRAAQATCDACSRSACRGAVTTHRPIYELAHEADIGAGHATQGAHRRVHLLVRAARLPHQIRDRDAGAARHALAAVHQHAAARRDGAATQRLLLLQRW